MLSRILLIIGSLLLFISLIIFWGRTTLFDADGFTDRATEALENQVGSDLLAGQIMGHGDTQALEVRQLILSQKTDMNVTHVFSGSIIL
jgi:hypothetical protein